MVWDFCFCTYTPVILVLEKLRQEDSEFETSLALARAILVSSVPSHPGLPRRPCLNKTKTNKQKPKINLQCSTSNTHPLGIMGSFSALRVMTSLPRSVYMSPIPFVQKNSPSNIFLRVYSIFLQCLMIRIGSCFYSQPRLWFMSRDPFFKLTAL